MIQGAFEIYGHRNCIVWKICEGGEIPNELKNRRKEKYLSVISNFSQRRAQGTGDVIGMSHKKSDTWRLAMTVWNKSRYWKCWIRLMQFPDKTSLQTMRRRVWSWADLTRKKLLPPLEPVLLSCPSRDLPIEAIHRAVVDSTTAITNGK